MTDERSGSPFLRTWLVAGLATGVIDGLFACVLAAFFFDSTVTRMFQGVASTVLGRSSYEGGIRTAGIGLAMHFGVAFAWSAIFLLLASRSLWLRRVLQSPGGVLKVAAVYGPLVWMTMSLAVIPLLVRRPPNVGTRWWIQLIGHIVFVGLPIVASWKWMGSKHSAPAPVP